MNKKIWLILGTILLFMGRVSICEAGQEQELWYVLNNHEFGLNKLEDEQSCWLCGDNERSLIDYYGKTSDVGIIDFNTWNVYPLDFCSQNANLVMNVNVSGKNECIFQIQHNDKSVEIQVNFG